MEYDALAKIITESPARSTQGQKIEDITAEIENLKATKTALEKKNGKEKETIPCFGQKYFRLTNLTNIT